MILSQGKQNQTERRKNKMSEKCDASWLNRAKNMTENTGIKKLARAGTNLHKKNKKCTN